MPQGRVLGGSSAINYMIYMRGNRGDYDHWRDLGNDGWGYEEVLPYFVKSEDNLGIQSRGLQNRYHGQGGPLSVVSHPPGNPLVERYFAAAQQAGIPFDPDFNGASQEGCGPMQATLVNNRRCSAATAYLHPARFPAQPHRADACPCDPFAVRRKPCDGSGISGASGPWSKPTPPSRSSSPPGLSARLTYCVVRHRA